MTAGTDRRDGVDRGHRAPAGARQPDADNERERVEPMAPWRGRLGTGLRPAQRPAGPRRRRPQSPDGSRLGTSPPTGSAIAEAQWQGRPPGALGRPPAGTRGSAKPGRMTRRQASVSATHFRGAAEDPTCACRWDSRTIPGRGRCRTQGNPQRAAPGTAAGAVIARLDTSALRAAPTSCPGELSPSCDGFPGQSSRSQSTGAWSEGMSSPLRCRRSSRSTRTDSMRPTSGAVR